MHPSFDEAKDERLKQLMQSLTKHLHNFIREVRLTEDKRHGFILLSNVLGTLRRRR